MGVPTLDGNARSNFDTGLRNFQRLSSDISSVGKGNSHALKHGRYTREARLFEGYCRAVLRGALASLPV